MQRTLRNLIAVLAAALAPLPALAAEFINVLTGGTSGVYYPLGVALSQIYGKALPNAKTSVQATKASGENLNLLQAGRGEIAFTLGDSLYEAWKGNEEAGFKTPLKKLRGVAADLPQLHPDRRRRRLRHQDAGRPQGQAGRGRRAEVRHRAQRARHLQGRRHELQGLRQGRVPALRRIGRADEEPPARRDADLRRPRRRRRARPGDVGAHRHRPDPGRCRAGRSANPPTWRRPSPPTPTRARRPTSPSAAVQNFLVTHEGVPADTVYAMTKAMFDQPRPAGAPPTRPPRRSTPRRAVEGMPVPLHPGAEKYYREAGLLK